MKVYLDINNSFEKQMIDSGYKIYSDNWSRSIRMFQKKIRDEIGIQYYINCFHYNFGKQILESDDYVDRYSFEVQFIKDKNIKDQVLDIRFSADFLDNPWRPKTSLKEVEDFFQNIFKNQGFDYSEKN